MKVCEASAHAECRWLFRWFWLIWPMPFLQTMRHKKVPIQQLVLPVLLTKINYVFPVAVDVSINFW